MRRRIIEWCPKWGKTRINALIAEKKRSGKEHLA